MSKKNKELFFVLDGPDGSGKTTQTKLLAIALKKKKRSVLVVDFPQYNTSFFGAMVGAYLKGEFGDVFTISPYLSSLLYALDRWSARVKIQQALNKGKIILANRYTSSNIIHQGAKFKNKRERDDFFQWLDIAEFTALDIPRPTRVLFLNVPTRISWNLIEHRNRATHPQGSARDKHEASRSHLQKAYKTARAYAKKNRTWSIIQCTKAEQLLSPEQVHTRVMKEVMKYI